MASSPLTCTKSPANGLDCVPTRQRAYNRGRSLLTLLFVPILQPLRVLPCHTCIRIPRAEMRVSDTYACVKSGRTQWFIGASLGLLVQNGKLRSRVIVRSLVVPQFYRPTLLSMHPSSSWDSPIEKRKTYVLYVAISLTLFSVTRNFMPVDNASRLAVNVQAIAVRLTSCSLMRASE